MKLTHLHLLLSLTLCAACEGPARNDQPFHAPMAELGRSVSNETREGLIDPANKYATPRKAPLQRKFTWHDGQYERSVWISETRLAEFAPVDESRNAVLSLDPASTETRGSTAGVRLWKLSRTLDTDQETRALNAGVAGAKTSPVFHDGPSEDAALRALPGGVIVRFPADWDRPRIDAFLAVQGVTIEKEIPIGVNAFLLATPAGIESLEIANRLHDTGELLMASPNWWNEGATR